MSDRDLRTTAEYMSARARTDGLIDLYLYERDQLTQAEKQGVDAALAHITASIKTVPYADSFDIAYNLVHQGALRILSGDMTPGKDLLRQAAKRLRHLNRRGNVFNHPQITLLRFELRGTAYHTTDYHRIEHTLIDKIADEAVIKTCYALAEAAVALVDCRIRQDNLAATAERLRQSADLLILALTIHPYPRHTLHHYGLNLLTQAVLPRFDTQMRLAYADELSDRVASGEAYFSYLINRQVDLNYLSRLQPYLMPSARTNRATSARLL